MDINSGTGISVAAVDDAAGSRVRYTVSQTGGAAALDRELVFHAQDFNANGVVNPNTDFTVYEAGVKVTTWKDPISGSAQNKLALQFRVPDDYDGLTDPTVKIKFFLDKIAGSAGTKVKWQMQKDARSDGQDIPAAGAFDQTVNSGDVAVSESAAAGDLRVHQASFTLDHTLIAAGDWIFLVLKRIATTVPADEYTKDIYFATLNFKYRRT